MMWVAPQHRGSRAASFLVGNLLSWAKNSGIDVVSLDVTDSNERAIRFYENQGFRDTGDRIDIDIERSLTGVRMTQTLG